MLARGKGKHGTENKRNKIVGRLIETRQKKKITDEATMVLQNKVKIENKDEDTNKKNKVMRRRLDMTKRRDTASPEHKMCGKCGG